MTSKQTHKILTNLEIAMFCEQISMMLKAGISPYEGVTILYDDALTDTGQQIYGVILKELEQGETLHHALTVSGVFPKYVLDMVLLGEKSGRLENVLVSLNHYYEREESIASGIRHAITYPAVMIMMMLFVVLVLITKVLPIFAQVYEQLGSELTGFSGSLLHLGTIMNTYATGIVFLLAALILFFFVFSRLSYGREKMHGMASHLLFNRSLQQNIAASRFAGGMALALQSGLDTDQGLELVSDLVDDASMQDKIRICRELIADGEGFSNALSQSGIFSNLYARMIAIGFKSGSVDTVLDKIADGYEEDTDQSIAHFISILEPTLIIVLSLVVGLILLSVLLPLLGIMSSIG